jgi:hypothetical protein
MPIFQRLVSNHQTTWHSNPENHEFCLHCHENIKSDISEYFLHVKFMEKYVHNFTQLKEKHEQGIQ